MKLKAIIVRLPAELLESLDEAAFAAHRSRDEFIQVLCRNATAGTLARHNEYISLESASERSGRSMGHLARMCRDEYGPRGLARMHRDGKHKAAWQIRTDAGPEFLPKPPAIEEA